MLAPICLFTYNRLSETQQTIEALKKNYLASKSELFIFSDGPKNAQANFKVAAVRQYLKTVTGFKTIEIIESISNKGLANSIISGVTQVIQKYGKVIVLEDDLITSPNFLDYMNQALDFYETNDKIYSISGFTLELESKNAIQNDYYLGYRSFSWGWATWKNRWKNIDWDIKNWKKILLTPALHQAISKGGSDIPLMLFKQQTGKIDSWAVRWCCNQLLNNQLTVLPKKSKIINIGFGENATHTKNINQKSITEIDNTGQTIFNFKEEIIVNRQLAKELKRQYSYSKRIRQKIKL